MKKHKSEILIIIFILVLWVAITTSIQRFKNHNLSETELFLAIPQSFILNFK